MRMSRSRQTWQRREAKRASRFALEVHCRRCRKMEKGESHVAQKPGLTGARGRFRIAAALKKQGA